MLVGKMNIVSTARTTSKPFSRMPVMVWQDQRERMKTSVIVITDGDPYPEKEKTILEDTLKSTAKKLDSLGYPEDQLVISFLQIGDNEEAMQYLQKLDDLAHPSRKHKITHFWHKGYRDIVDCVPYKDNVQFTGDMVVKALVGSLDPKVDKFKT
ncbi:hypothetical protein FA95DRAFT_479792 [Auriscalpium vulgare]|uniref:Uncharacterized protein n=1 Tax=Auriscalpium vulgare TaxID=40419 RepID=A0ACB8SB45_9AGAM|nr:hypothetical protein FA95DRAFT_479792 [Auriscalpium vulgare]